jgi:anti-sigma B factor antagonist
VRDLVVDLSDAAFIDSTAIGVLAGRQRQLRALNGEVRLVCANPDVLRTIDISGMARIFQVHPNLSEALAAAAGEGP